MTTSQSHKGGQGIICDKLALMTMNFDENFANGVLSYDGCELWEVSNTILVEGEHKDKLLSMLKIQKTFYFNHDKFSAKNSQGVFQFDFSE